VDLAGQPLGNPGDSPRAAALADLGGPGENAEVVDLSAERTKRGGGAVIDTVLGEELGKSGKRRRDHAKPELPAALAVQEPVCDVIGVEVAGPTMCPPASIRVLVVEVRL
jgi:hypothetical protein